MSLSLIECSVHPLVPGGLLAAMLASTDPVSPREVAVTDLEAFSRLPLAEVIKYFVTAGRLTAEDSKNLLAVEEQYSRIFRSLEKRIPDLANVTGCDAKWIRQLAANLFSARLLAEFLEIVAAPQISFERNATGTVDLLEALSDSFREFVGGAWAVFFPRENFSLAADASAQFWVACLYNSQPADMANSFIGLFHADQKDRFQMLNCGYVPDRRVRLRDAITEYLDNSRDKLNKLHDTLDPQARLGLDRVFQEMARTIKKLGLPGLMILYYEKLAHEICDAFSAMDGGVSSRELRFIQYLNQQISGIVQEQLSSGPAVMVAGGESLETVLQDLDEMVGITEVKAKVRQLANFARIQQLRVGAGLKRIPSSDHLVYTGNPGTGKTSVARLMGRIYRCLGVLKKGHLVECDRAALVAEYVGQTAIRTNAVVDSALDGILFIDEAYALNKEQPDFGSEAIETLLKRMEDNRDRLIVIVAGYPAEMENFIRSNPGFQSRFTRVIQFPDYSPLELCRIFGLMCRRNGLRLTPALREALIHHFYHLHEEREENFGNARLVRNCFEGIINAQATRLSALLRIETEALSLLEAADLESDAHERAADYRKQVRGYQVKCDHCGQVYAWKAELDLREAQCTACNKVYDGEFGFLAEGA